MKRPSWLAVGLLTFFPALGFGEVGLDPDSGLLIPPGDSWNRSFDAPEPGVHVLELGSIPSDAPEVFDEAEAVQGTGSMVLDARFRAVEIELADAPFAGRRVRASVWFRAEGTDLDAHLTWRIGERTELSLAFVPTGRATSDGWVELTTGPVDFEAVGIPAAVVRLQDGFDAVRGRFYQRHDDARVRVDALVIEDLGPATTLDADCRAPEEASVCGEGICALGRCIDRALWRGVPPVDARWRQAMIDRRLFQFGFHHAQRSKADSIAVLEQRLADTAQRQGLHFTSTFVRAFEDSGFDHFRAGHGSGFESIVRKLAPGGSLNRPPPQLCLVSGQADLLPNRSDAPLVASFDSDLSIFDALRRGDALVAVDGLDWRDWLSVARGDSLACPNLTEGQSDLAATMLVWDVMLRGANLTFERCSLAAARPCEADEVESIELDLAAVIGARFWRGEGLVTPTEYCRPEFSQLSGIGPPWVEDRGRIRRIVVDGLSAEFEYTSRLKAGLTGDFDALIIDQRNGTGGRLSTSQLIAESVSPAADAMLSFIPPMELTPAARAEIERCRDSESVCQELDQFHMGLSAETAGVSADRPLVVLNGAVYSANEMWMAALGFRTAPTRIMGHAGTHGSMGTPMGLSALPGQQTGPWFVTRDSFINVRDTPVPVSPAWLSGTGWMLDESCRQKQSDAVAGIDTCVEAAISWIQREL